VVTTNCTTDHGRARPVTDAGFTQAGCGTAGIAGPVIVETAYTHAPVGRSRGADGPMQAQTTIPSLGVATPFLAELYGCSTARAGTEPLSACTAGGTNQGLVSERLPVMVETAYGAKGERLSSGGSDPARAQTTGQTMGVALPVLASTNEFDPRALSATGPSFTQTTQAMFGVGVPPSLIVPAGSLEGPARRDTDPLAAQTGSERLGVAVPAPYMVDLYGAAAQARGVEDPAAAVCGNGHAALVIDGAAIVTLRSAEYLFRGLESPLPVQVAAAAQDYLLSPREHLFNFNNAGISSGLFDGVPTATTVDRSAVVGPTEEINIDEWYFRMLHWREIRSAMAFQDGYAILGGVREKVKQLGNAVTPPVMRALVARCREALNHGGDGGKRGRRAA
jgi:hypothetical protein